MARRLTVLILIAGSLSGSGCMLPDYYQPGGYSSTSLKRLDESQVEWPESGWSMPKSPFRLVADTNLFGTKHANGQNGIDSASGDDIEAEPSRVANHRGRFAAH